MVKLAVGWVKLTTPLKIVNVPTAAVLLLIQMICVDVRFRETSVVIVDEEDEDDEDDSKMIKEKREVRKDT
eukprot:scaffold659_cov192-Ochromonas_danica.AAC.18